MPCVCASWKGSWCAVLKGLLDPWLLPAGMCRGRSFQSLDSRQEGGVRKESRALPSQAGSLSTHSRDGGRGPCTLSKRLRKFLTEVRSAVTAWSAEAALAKSQGRRLWQGVLVQSSEGSAPASGPQLISSQHPVCTSPLGDLTGPCPVPGPTFTHLEMAAPWLPFPTWSAGGRGGGASALTGMLTAPGQTHSQGMPLGR